MTVRFRTELLLAGFIQDDRGFRFALANTGLTSTAEFRTQKKGGVSATLDSNLFQILHFVGFEHLHTHYVDGTGVRIDVSAQQNVVTNMIFQGLGIFYVP